MKSEPDEDPILETADVVFKGASTKQAGSLVVYQSHVAWSTAGQHQWRVTYDKIRGQRVSPAHKPKVQLQVCAHEGEPHTFVFVCSQGHDAQIAAREAVKDAIQNALVQRTKALASAAAVGSGKTGAVTEKERLLAENKTAGLLYEQLVSTGIVTAKQFWTEFVDTNTRKLTTAEEDASGTQQLGVSAAFLSSIQQHDGCNNVSLNLTQHVRQQIFNTYPSVKKRHTELVPGEMNELEFWTAFFQSHYFHRDRTANLNPKDVFTQCLKLDDQAMRELTESERRVSHYNLNQVNDEALGYLREEPSSSARGSSAHKAAIMRQFNFHSSRVLDCGEGEAGPSSAAASIRMPSFKLGKRSLGDDAAPSTSSNPTQQPTLVINIGAATAVVNGHTTAPASDADKAALQRLPVVDVVDTAACTRYMTGFVNELTKDQQGAAHDAAAVKVVRVLRAVLDELLRHFWSCFPVNTPDKKDKLERMIHVLRRFDDERINTLMAKFEHKYREHLDQLLGAALTKFDQYQSRAKKRRV